MMKGLTRAVANRRPRGDTSLAALAGTAWRSRIRRDILDELHSHIQMDTEHLMALGMPYRAARRQALMNLGGVQPTLESCDDAVRRPPVWRLIGDRGMTGRALCAIGRWFVSHAGR